MTVALALAQCLRASPSETELAQLRNLTPAEWERLAEIAARYELAPLLHARLRSSPLHAFLPPATAQRLTRAYLDAAAAGLRWQHQLLRLLKQLRRCGPPVLAFGDAVLASTVYGNAALGSPRRLDLLVRAEDLDALSSCLLALDTCVDREGGASNPCGAAVFVSLKEGDIPVWVHPRLLPPDAPFRVPADELASIATTALLEGVEAPVLRPEILLLQLCMREASRLETARLYPARLSPALHLYFDLAQVVERYASGLNWEQVIARARDWQAGAAAYLCLSLAREFAGAAIPEAVLAQLAPDAPGAAQVARAREQLLAQLEQELLAQPLPALPAFDALDTGAVDEALLALSPENPLIGCLRGRWQPAAPEIAQCGMPDAAAEWELWARTAVRSGVAPLLLATLRYQPAVPEALKDALQATYTWHLRHNTRTLRELARALDTLHREGIPTLLLKGAALGIAVYGNVGLRPMGDIDLLVRREDAARALALLEGLGYASSGAETRPGATLAYENEVALRHTAKPDLAPVELHWGLLDSPHYQSALDMPWFWETAQPIAFEGVSTLILGPEAQLLHLCAHLMLHHAGASGNLLWYHDIAEVLVAYRDALDWSALFAAAGAGDLVLPLQRVLPVVWDCWQIAPPAGVRGRLAALQPSAIEVQLYAQLTTPARPVAQRFFTDLASMPGWRQRWAYAWENIFPAPAYIRDRYHVAHPLLLPFAYLWRWVRGLLSLLGRQH